MQDWSMIPLHVRCTERYKIDSNYPEDDARWWALNEAVANRDTRGPSQPVYSHIPDIVLDFAETFDGNRMALESLAGACKVGAEDLGLAMRARRKK